MDYPEVFRASPARVVALLRCQDLHQPLSAQLGSHHGFHVLCVPDSDAEYPPPVAERKPENARASKVQCTELTSIYCATFSATATDPKPPSGPQHDGG